MATSGGANKLNTKIDKIDSQTPTEEVLRVIQVWEEHVQGNHTSDVANAVASDLYEDEEEFQTKMGADIGSRKPSVMPEALAAEKPSTAAIVLHKDNVTLHLKVVQAVMDDKKILLGYFSADDRDALKKEDDNRPLMAYSMGELVLQIKDTYGKYKEYEIMAIKNSLGSAMSDAQDMIAHIARFKKNKKTLEDNNQGESELSLTEAFKQSVGGSLGVYSEALKDFGKLEDGKTWLTLSEMVRKDHLRLKNLSAAAAGFAAAAVVAPPTRASQAAAGGSRGGGGRWQPSQQGPNGGRVDRGPRRIISNGRVTGIMMDTHYCWSHGPNGGKEAHHSPACNDKEPGHINAATAEDIQGGRIRYCRADRRHLFPHP